MKGWAGSTGVAGRRRQEVVRAALAVVMAGALVWWLPVRRAGEQGGHGAPPALDLFERAGVTEFTEGQAPRPLVLAVFGEDRQVSLDDFRGRLVILNFWATWCQPCTVEMPALEALWQAYRDRGLVVLGVSVDRGAPRSLIEPYVRNLELTFPILLDPELQAAAAWRVTGLPATFLIRPGGEVAGMAVGAREWNGTEIRALIDTLLPGRRH